MRMRTLAFVPQGVDFMGHAAACKEFPGTVGNQTLLGSPAGAGFSGLSFPRSGYMAPQAESQTGDEMASLRGIEPLQVFASLCQSRLNLHLFASLDALGCPSRRGGTGMLRPRASSAPQSLAACRARTGRMLGKSPDSCCGDECGKLELLWTFILRVFHRFWSFLH